MSNDLRTVSFCLPGACLTAFVRPDDDPAKAAEALARKYEAQTGVELTEYELEQARERIARRQREED